jgi:phosphoserine phosphatase
MTVPLRKTGPLHGRQRGILLDQAVAAGDGANDRLTLGQVGPGIAYNAGRRLEQSAGSMLARNKLKNNLYILGIAEDDMRGSPG